MPHRLLALLPAMLLVATAAQAAEPALCEARSAARQTPLVELYTSEGCSSCPPADRWLSTLKGAPPPGQAQPPVLAAAFHVSYWDRLGWTDRFASADFTARQSALMRASGARYVYTPQVLVDGRDWRGWPVLPLASAAPARASILLQRRGDRVAVQVAPGPGAPPQLALWWALLEDGHGSAVSAGENRGEQLRHDHVVRRYGQVPAWATTGTAQQLPPLLASAKGEGGRMARLLVVVTDAATGAPLQAAQLVCPPAG
ncbi:MAG: DUF1223 domain-containing protein [Pseudomonadota bacterium]